MSLGKRTATGIMLILLVAMVVGDWFLTPEQGWYFTVIILVLVLIVIGFAVLGAQKFRQ